MARQTSDTIDRGSRFVSTDQQITSQLGDESVILGLNDGIYYGLDAIGTRIWTLLGSPRSIGEICETLEQDYDVDRSKCQDAVTELVRDLLMKGLVETSQ